MLARVDDATGGRLDCRADVVTLPPMSLRAWIATFARAA
jgi:hypothetical protein